MAEIAPGLKAEMKVVVTEEQTARHLGSGGVSVLATPEMIRLMERTSLAAVQPYLAEGQQTVGVRVDVRHLAATPMGMAVTIRSELIKVDGRRLTFQVEASDEVEKVGEGIHERVIIDVNRFKERTERKKRQIEG
jgi:fluoroacetyl-CoA thioesterase